MALTIQRVNALPGTLAAETIYLVKTGNGTATGFQFLVQKPIQLSDTIWTLSDNFSLLAPSDAATGTDNGKRRFWRPLRKNGRRKLMPCGRKNFHGTSSLPW